MCLIRLCKYLTPGCGFTETPESAAHSPWPLERVVVGAWHVFYYYILLDSVLKVVCESFLSTGSQSDGAVPSFASTDCIIYNYTFLHLYQEMCSLQKGISGDNVL